MSYFLRMQNMRTMLEQVEGHQEAREGLSHVFKFNPYHDEQGRFASGDGAAKTSYGVKVRALAQGVTDLSKRTEAHLSPILKAALPDGARFVFWDARLKGQGSLERKIFKDAQSGKISLEQAASHIGDGVRYTVVAPLNKYAGVVRTMLSNLAQNGYTVIPGKFKNYWHDGQGPTPMYQGININLMAPTGQKWELQFHTQQSFEVKEHQNHPFYEEHRLMVGKLTPEKQRRHDALERIMSENQSKVTRPPGAHLIGPV